MVCKGIRVGSLPIEFLLGHFDLATPGCVSARGREAFMGLFVFEALLAFIWSACHGCVRRMVGFQFCMRIQKELKLNAAN